MTMSTPMMPATETDTSPASAADRVARRLEQACAGQRKPPLHLWHPALSGDMDMVIRRNGDWVHEGTVIKRQGLVNIFSSILRREVDDHYYLVTPVEKWRIRVDDAPFLITTVSREQHEGVDCVLLTCNTGEVIVAGRDHPVWLEERNGEPAPYVLVRDRLHALIGRNAWYELLSWCEDETLADGEHVLHLASAGQRFEMGRYR